LLDLLEAVNSYTKEKSLPETKFFGSSPRQEIAAEFMKIILDVGVL